MGLSSFDGVGVIEIAVYLPTSPLPPLSIFTLPSFGSKRTHSEASVKLGNNATTLPWKSRSFPFFRMNLSKFSKQAVSIFADRSFSTPPWRTDRLLLFGKSDGQALNNPANIAYLLKLSRYVE